ncbi:MAG TPA: AAA family ATPase [Stellaceae bacterium]|nr:AAA family ATPase [Stellaceae bacterium]
MATLHLICGKAASGKTTLGRELAARHAAVLFREDEWLTLLEARFDEVTRYFTPPSGKEGFRVIRHDADIASPTG